MRRPADRLSHRQQDHFFEVVKWQYFSVNNPICETRSKEPLSNENGSNFGKKYIQESTADPIPMRETHERMDVPNDTASPYPWKNENNCWQSWNYARIFIV